MARFKPANDYLSASPSITASYNYSYLIKKLNLLSMIMYEIMQLL